MSKRKGKAKHTTPPVVTVELPVDLETEKTQEPEKPKNSKLIFMPPREAP